MNSTQENQRKRLFVEAIVIVASILLAFSIDAWWQERSEGVRLAGAIQNIAAEVGSDRDEIEQAVSKNQFRIDGMRLFLSLRPDELLILPQDSVTSIGEAFVTPSPFDTSGFALRGLLTGGNMEIIADEELRNALIAWAQFPNEIERDYAESVQFFMAFFERIVKYGVYTALTNETTDHAIPGAVQMRDALVSLRSDAEAVEAMALFLLSFEDFNGQLALGLDYADRVLKASQLTARQDDKPIRRK
jgi:hypothetical protein